MSDRNGSAFVSHISSSAFDDALPAADANDHNLCHDFNTHCSCSQNREVGHLFQMDLPDEYFLALESFHMNCWCVILVILCHLPAVRSSD